MKRFWIFSAIIIALYSCTENTELDTPETEDEQLELDGGYAITATISMSQSDDESETRISSDTISGDAAEWVFTWDASDASDNVYLMSKVSDSSFESNAMTSTDVADEASTATFMGTLNSASTAYSILYTSGSAIWGSTPSSTPNYSDSSSDSIILDLSQGQTGKEVNMIDNLVMISDLTKESLSEKSNISPTLYHVGSFMILDISFANVPEHWRNVTVESISYSGVNTKCVIHPTTYAYTEADFYDYDNIDEQPTIEIAPEETITVNNSATAKFYLNILPTTMEDGNEITTTLHFSNGTYIEITKEFKQQVIFDRAQFNTTTVECDLGSGSYDYTSENGTTINGIYTSDDTNEYVATDIGQLQYVFDGDTVFDYNTKDYSISSKEHLYALAALTNAGNLEVDSTTYTFTLKNDIRINGSNTNKVSDMSDSELEELDLWTPIGYYSVNTHEKIIHFEGVFDGAGHTISGYYAYMLGDENIFISLGLFGYVADPKTTIKNLLIADSKCVTNKGGSHAAILAATLNYGATIINCGCEEDTSVSLNANGAVGSLVGCIDHESIVTTIYILNSYNQGSVTGNASSGAINVGGLCGKAYDATESSEVGYTIINGCYNTGELSTGNSSSSSKYIGYCVGAGYSGDIYVNIYNNESINSKINAIGSGSYTEYYWAGLSTDQMKEGVALSCSGYNAYAGAIVRDNATSFIDLLEYANDDIYYGYEGYSKKSSSTYITIEGNTEVSTWTQTLGSYPRLTFTPYTPDTSKTTDDDGSVTQSSN